MESSLKELAGYRLARARESNREAFASFWDGEGV